jgi:hypothetical protein
LITCISTLVSLVILWLLWKILRALWLVARAPRGGWKIEVVEDVDGERWKQGVWVRRRPRFVGRVKKGWKKLRTIVRKSHEDGNDPDVLVTEERRPLLG